MFIIVDGPAGVTFKTHHLDHAQEVSFYLYILFCFIQLLLVLIRSLFDFVEYMTCQSMITRDTSTLWVITSSILLLLLFIIIIYVMIYSKTFSGMFLVAAFGSLCTYQANYNCVRGGSSVRNHIHLCVVINRYLLD